MGEYAAETLRVSPRSTPLYRATAKQFANWCVDNGRSFPSVTTGDILDFQDFLRSTKRNKDSTVRSKTGHLAHFYRWAVSVNAVGSSPMVGIPRQGIKVQPRVPFSVSELRQLWETSPTPRHQALIGLLGILGLRCDDVTALDVTDIRRAEPYGSLNLHYRSGPRADIQVLVAPQIMQVIEEVAGSRRSGPLLTTRAGSRLTRHAVAGILKTSANASGLGVPVTSSSLSYTLRGLALEHGFSYQGTIAATGEIGASHGRSWVPVRSTRPEQHAMIRLAHLVFEDPGSTFSMLFEAGVALTESALPPAIAVMTAGAALERHLRELARARGITFDKAESKLQLSAYIARLTAARIVLKTDHGILTTIEGWRNKAAHGWFDEVDRANAEWVLNHCRLLIERYPLEA